MNKNEAMVFFLSDLICCNEAFKGLSGYQTHLMQSDDDIAKAASIQRSIPQVLVVGVNALVAHDLLHNDGPIATFKRSNPNLFVIAYTTTPKNPSPLFDITISRLNKSEDDVVMEVVQAVIDFYQGAIQLRLNI